jgi:dihydropteroate synthase
MTKLMGILNVTPDSFYSASRSGSTEAAIARGLQIAAEGADIIDIGGESSRPKNDYANPADKPVTIQEELDRVIPVILELKKQLSILISIDTMKYQVAAKAIDAGANWINDVSGFRDPEMRAVASSSPHAKLCVMHMLGSPHTMQLDPVYEGGVIESIKHWFSDILEKLIQAGVKENQIVLDPGIGFGKTVAHNLEIIHNLPELKSLGFPLLLGASRKQFMRRILNKPTEELLAATLAIDTIAILSKVDYIRVHDIQAHKDIIDLLNAYQQVR